MKYDPAKHHRRSIRLKGYAYASPGAYFVTICTQNHECVLGDVVDGHMMLNDTGRIADQVWPAVADHFAGVEIDLWVTMPNHVHAIIVICTGAVTAPVPAPVPAPTLGKIVAYFKYQTKVHQSNA